MYISTAGVGVIPPDGRSSRHVRPGDVVLVSGTIADHGMAVMLARGDLALETDIRSDTAPLGGLGATRCSRPRPGRAGCATRRAAASARSCNELARDTDLAVVLDEADLPMLPAVNGACDLLGIDPLYVANEGKFVAVVARRGGDAALGGDAGASARAAAARIGEIVAEPEGIVVLRTTFGGTRIVDMLVGDPLPRIC